MMMAGRKVLDGRTSPQELIVSWELKKENVVKKYIYFVLISSLFSALRQLPKQCLYL